MRLGELLAKLAGPKKLTVKEVDELRRRGNWAEDNVALTMTLVSGSPTPPPIALDHGGLGGLSHDDHTQYLLENTILLYDSLGEALRSQPPTQAGLVAIIALATSGDTIWIPPATISGDHTVPAGVRVVGGSRYASILSGQVTLGATTSLENLSIVRSVNSATAHKGVVVGASGTSYISNCDVEVTNAGAGAAYGVSVDGNGNVECWSCYLYGNSTSGNGYAAYHAGGTGNAYIYGGRCYGSTGTFNV